MSREPIPTYFFVLVVVEQAGRFVLVQEARHGNTWYLPAGRVEPGEDFATAAKREVREEAGIEVELKGIVRIEHTPEDDYTRVRVVYYAQPSNEVCELKNEPDHDTLGARWFLPEEMRQLPMRGLDVMEYIDHIADGKMIMQLDVIGREKLNV